MTAIKKKKLEEGVYRVVGNPSGYAVQFKANEKKNYETVIGSLEPFEAEEEFEMITAREG